MQYITKIRGRGGFLAGGLAAEKKTTYTIRDIAMQVP